MFLVVSIKVNQSFVYLMKSDCEFTQDSLNKGKDQREWNISG